MGDWDMSACVDKPSGEKVGLDWWRLEAAVYTHFLHTAWVELGVYDRNTCIYLQAQEKRKIWFEFQCGSKYFEINRLKRQKWNTLTDRFGCCCFVDFDDADPQRETTSHLVSLRCRQISRFCPTVSWPRYCLVEVPAIFYSVKAMCLHNVVLSLTFTGLSDSFSFSWADNSSVWMGLSVLCASQIVTSYPSPRSLSIFSATLLLVSETGSYVCVSA